MFSSPKCSDQLCGPPSLLFKGYGVAGGFLPGAEADYSPPSSTKLNTFTAIVNLSQFNNSCLKSPASTLVDLIFQSRALRSFSLNQLRDLSL